MSNDKINCQSCGALVAKKKYCSSCGALLGADELTELDDDIRRLADIQEFIKYMSS